MGNPKIITKEIKEIDILSFQKKIFISNANFISRVAIYPENKDFQPFKHYTEEDGFIKEDQRPNSQWNSFAIMAGIGQYSLMMKKPAGFLSRLDSYLRNPTEEEMETDFQNLGKHNLKSAVTEVTENKKEKHEYNKIFKVNGKDYWLVGPRRIVKSVFSSRVFSGNIPEDISGLVKEVDEVAETGEMIVNKNYDLFYSIEGKIKYVSFKIDYYTCIKIEEYAPSKLEDWGAVKLLKMVCYLKGLEEKPIDITEYMYKKV